MVSCDDAVVEMKERSSEESRNTGRKMQSRSQSFCVVCADELLFEVLEEDVPVVAPLIVQ